MKIKLSILAISLSLTACTVPSSFDPNDVSGVGVARFSRDENGSIRTPGPDRDCNSFSSSLAAQQFFINAGGPQSDPHDLDRDGDGYACEWGAELKQRAAATEAAQRRTALARQQRARAASRCFTGPRGGTYTLTSSGNKNYGGC